MNQHVILSAAADALLLVAAIPVNAQELRRITILTASGG